RAVAKQKILPGVRALIEVVAELVVDRLEVLGVDLRAHLDPQIVAAVQIPRGRVADDLAVAGLREQRSLPERLGQRVEAERGEERLAGPHHALRRIAPLVQDAGEIDTRSARMSVE